MTDTLVTEPQNEEETPSRWEDLIDILYAPTAVFERRRNAGFGWMLVILTVLLAALLVANMTVLAPVYQAEMMESLRASGNEGAMDPSAMGRIGLIFGVIGFAIGFPISVLIIGLLLWGGAKIFGAALGFTSAALIATYSQVPIIFQQIVTIIQGLVLDVRSMDSIRDVTLSVARFLPDSTPPLMMALAGRIEVFGLWGLALMTIGLSVIGRISKGQAFIVALIVWLLSALPEVLGAVMAG